jgi:hypothetical protein
MAGHTAEAYQHEADLLAALPRPKAPTRYHLTAEENEEWDKIVAALPPNWFSPENYGVLVSHVTAIVQVREIADMIRECKKKKDWVNARFLLIEQHKLNDQVKKFAIKLKITSRASQATLQQELKIRRDMERRLPTIQHTNPWSKSDSWHGQDETNDTQSSSPWDNRGAAKEAAG